MVMTITFCRDGVASPCFAEDQLDQRKGGSVPTEGEGMEALWQVDKVSPMATMFLDACTQNLLGVVSLTMLIPLGKRELTK